MYRAILFIGRFQPLHNGHVAALRQALRECTLLLIGIGSSNAPRKPRNPFSFSERARMMRLALGELRIPPSRYRIIALPDYFNDRKWAEQVLHHRFDAAYSRSAWVVRCLKGKKPILRPTLVKRGEYRATLIRLRMREGKPWKHFVPPSVASYLSRIGAPRRLRSLQ